MDNGRGILYSVNMGILNRVDIKSYFEKKFSLPVIVSNDLVSHSLCESIFGIGRGIDRIVECLFRNWNWTHVH